MPCWQSNVIPVQEHLKVGDVNALGKAVGAVAADLRLESTVVNDVLSIWRGSDVFRLDLRTGEAEFPETMRDVVNEVKRRYAVNVVAGLQRTLESRGWQVRKTSTSEMLLTRVRR